MTMIFYPKFRAWHKELKQLAHVDALFIADGCVIIEGLEFPASFEAISKLHEWDLKEVELMQWSGLWASGGVEIYDGDIIEMYDDWGMEQFSYRRTYWSSIGINPEVYVPWNQNPALFGKVIGNVYEHSYLLAESREKINEKNNNTPSD